MALEPDELYGSRNDIVKRSRAYPRDQDGIRPGTLATLAGAPELPHLTPLAYDEGADEWNVWNPAVGAVAEIKGFLWIPGPAGFQSSATGEKLIQVFRAGRVHHDDIPVPTTAAQTQALLTAALTDTSGLRSLGIDVSGVGGVH